MALDTPVVSKLVEESLLERSLNEGGVYFRWNLRGTFCPYPEADERQVPGDLQPEDGSYLVAGKFVPGENDLNSDGFEATAHISPVELSRVQRLGQWLFRLQPLMHIEVTISPPDIADL